MDSLNKDRRTIFFMAVSLTLFGLLMVYDSSSIYAWKTMHDQAYFLKRQLLYFMAGLIVFTGMLFVELEWLKKHSFAVLAVNCALLVLVLIQGKKTGGARRWLYLAGFGIQPSEFLKLSFLIWSAYYFERKRTLLKNLSRGILPLMLVSGTIFCLVVLEPDLGTVMFWSLWLYLSLFLLGAKKRHLVSLAVAGTFSAFCLIKMCPYRFSRIVAYLNPWADPRGSGFQLIQAQIAYGRGGLMGVGFGESKQKLLFLPAAHTDFIYSIIAEEFGFLGSMLVLAFLTAFSFKIFKLHFKIKENFRRNLCLGIGLIFALEVVINIGVSCGIFPTKGLPLPLISYGGSSLLVHYALLGLLFNASKENENIISR